MTDAAFVPGHSGGAVPVLHRIPYSSGRTERPDTSDQFECVPGGVQGVKRIEVGWGVTIFDGVVEVL